MMSRLEPYLIANQYVKQYTYGVERACVWNVFSVSIGRYQHMAYLHGIHINKLYLELEERTFPKTHQ